MSQRPNRARRTNTGSNRLDRSRSGRAGSGRAGSGRSRSSRPPVKGKRGSVKAVAQRQVNRRGAVNSRNLKRVKTPHRAPRIVFVVALCVIIIGAGAAAVLSQTDTAKYATCEQHRPVVQQACKDCGLDTDWTDCLLAAMVVESGGDKNVRSVLNVEGDIMQAAEGAYGWIVMNGWPERGIAAESTEASIYAGVMEFKQNLQLWEGYLGTITPNDATEIQLVIQGYNFGADGWFAWCKQRNVHAYTVELAREYSETKMPADAKGTPTHAQKWLTAYDAIHGSHRS